MKRQFLGGYYKPPLFFVWIKHSNSFLAGFDILSSTMLAGIANSSNVSLECFRSFGSFGSLHLDGFDTCQKLHTRQLNWKQYGSIQYHAQSYNSFALYTNGRHSLYTVACDCTGIDGMQYRAIVPGTIGLYTVTAVCIGRD